MQMIFVLRRDYFVYLFILCVMHISAGKKNLIYKTIIFRDIGSTKSNVMVREL